MYNKNSRKKSKLTFCLNYPELSLFTASKPLEQEYITDYTNIPLDKNPPRLNTTCIDNLLR
jgi:hypothetical protein